MLKFRLLRQKDIKSVSDLIRRLYPGSIWQFDLERDMYLSFKDQKASNYDLFKNLHLAFDSLDFMIGMGAVTCSHANTFIYELSFIGVTPELQRHGTGKEIVKHLLNTLLSVPKREECKLVILSCDSKLISFYSQFGFNVSNYFDDQVLMTLDYRKMWSNKRIK